MLTTEQWAAQRAARIAEWQHTHTVANACGHWTGWNALRHAECSRLPLTECNRRALARELKGVTHD